MKAIIYKIFSPSGKSYIGSTTTSLLRRMEVHYSYLEKDSHYNHILQAAYNKYGKENMSIEILEEFEYEELKEVIEREQYYLDLLKPGYNICKRAYVAEMTDDIREKISKSLKGIKHSEERINNIKEGIKKSKEQAKEEGREWKVRLERRTEKEIEYHKSMQREILVCTFAGYVIFPSVKDACEAMGISTSQVRRHLKNQAPTFDGFWFLYNDDGKILNPRNMTLNKKYTNKVEFKYCSREYYNNECQVNLGFI